MIPTSVVNHEPSKIEKVYNFHGEMTNLAKKAVSELHTQELEGLLQNFSLLMAGNYGEEKSVEFPVDVIRETALFAGVALSRLLWERYKLERTLGRSVVDRKPNDPDKDELTKAVSGDKV